jgi:hypothetical protein
METEELIRRLAADAGPVRRLRPAWARAGLWLAVALPYVAAVVWSNLTKLDLGLPLSDTRFLVEQAATFLTAITAAVAAFRSIVPGFDRRILLLPVVPLLVWLGSVGQGCLDDWLRLGPAGLQIRPDWDCVPMASVISIVPAVAIFMMLRRGAPLYPRLTLVLAAIAVAAIGSFGLQIFHFRDASIMVLIWHVGSVLLLSMIAGALGDRLLVWRRPQAVST